MDHHTGREVEEMDEEDETAVVFLRVTAQGKGYLAWRWSKTPVVTHEVILTNGEVMTYLNRLWDGWSLFEEAVEAWSVEVAERSSFRRRWRSLAGYQDTFNDDAGSVKRRRRVLESQIDTRPQASSRYIVFFWKRRGDFSDTPLRHHYNKLLLVSGSAYFVRVSRTTITPTTGSTAATTLQFRWLSAGVMVSFPEIHRQACLPKIFGITLRADHRQTFVVAKLTEDRRLDFRGSELNRGFPPPQPIRGPPPQELPWRRSQLKGPPPPLPVPVQPIPPIPASDPRGPPLQVVHGIDPDRGLPVQDFRGGEP
jgi:hypothetical protein